MTMNSIAEKHPNGAFMLEGTNKIVQNKANNFYTHKKMNVCIVRYKHIAQIDSNVDNVRNEKEYLKLAEENNFQTRCEVCNAKLYKVVKENGKYFVRVKKQLIFIDSLGKSHYTCFQVNACYRKSGVNFDITSLNALSSDREHIINRVNMPSFNSLFNSIESFKKIDKEEKDILYYRLETPYEDFIKPFIKKWVLSEINKFNLISFMFDFDNLKKHIAIINNSSLQNEFVIKIFEIIGIDQIKDYNFLDNSTTEED